MSLSHGSPRLQAVDAGEVEVLGDEDRDLRALRLAQRGGMLIEFCTAMPAASDGRRGVMLDPLSRTGDGIGPSSTMREQQRAAETVPEVRVDLTVEAGPAKRVGGGRAQADGDAGRRDRAGPEHEEAPLALAQAARYSPSTLVPFSISTTRAVVGIDVARDQAADVARRRRCPSPSAGCRGSVAPATIRKLRSGKPSRPRLTDGEPRRNWSSSVATSGDGGSGAPGPRRPRPWRSPPRQPLRL